jgi:hypothetical protein
VTPGSVFGGLFAGEEWNGRWAADHHGWDDRAARIAMSLPIAAAAGDEDQLVGRL